MLLSLEWILGWALVPLLSACITGCAELSPPRVSWDREQSVIGPTIPEPQGILLVYSESYEGGDDQNEELPTTYRRPIFLYDSAGQFRGEFNNPPLDNEPIRLVLPPGRYIVVSKSQKKLRKLQVEVDNGLTTTVSESQIAQASRILSSEKTLQRRVQGVT